MGNCCCCCFPSCFPFTGKININASDVNSRTSVLIDRENSHNGTITVGNTNWKILDDDDLYGI